MNPYLIDSASTYEIVTGFREHNRDLTDCFPWTRYTALAVTAKLIGDAHVDLAPAPMTDSGSPSDQYGLLMNQLIEIFNHPEPTQEEKTVADIITIEWASKNNNSLKTQFTNTINENDSFPRWIDESIRFAWLEHATRLKGLFNPQYIPIIASVLGESVADLEKDHSAINANPEIVLDIANYRNSNPRYFLRVRNAYVLSALIRGRYHGNISALTDCGLMSHPIRWEYMPDVVNPKPSYNQCPKVVTELATLIVQTSFDSSKYDERIKRFAHNIKEARQCIPFFKNIESENDDYKRRERLFELIRSRQFTFTPKEAIKLTSAAFNVAPLLISFIFTPWYIGGMIALLEFISISYSSDELIAKWIYERRSRLENMLDIQTIGSIKWTVKPIENS